MRIGSLFSGYGGLDLAVQSVLGGELAWYSEIEPAACKVLAAHHPGVPNLGDITKVDWADVEPVDILTGGYPCQPFSHAGKRKGTDDERHLWPYVRDAIAAIRPMVAVFENVDGHRSLGLADVLGDLAELGMSVQWGVVRAADAGAPHGRKRIFIVAHPGGRSLAGLSAAGIGLSIAAERGDGDTAHTVTADPDRDGYGGGQDAGRVGRVDSGHAGQARQRQRPRAQSVSGVPWGKYEPAIRRWEAVTDRPAPDPTVPSNNGNRRLNPAFAEWMMGLPAGHVTGHGLSAAQELKMLGNGVVPQQAALALRLLGVGA